MDLLSDSLCALSFEELNITNFSLRAPWAFHTSGFTPGFNLIVKKGRCHLILPDGSPRTLEAGQAVLLPRGGEIQFASRRGQTSVPLTRLWQEEEYTAIGEAPAALHTKEWGEQGEVCEMLGFAFNMSESAEALILPHLPSVILQPVPVALAALISALDQYLQLLSDDGEGLEQGQFAERARFAEGIVIGQLRQHITQTEFEAGWIAGLKHPRLSPALLAIHKRFHESWSVASLAALCGMSRASFARHFGDTLGQSPMDYLGDWRARRAHALLVKSTSSLANIAYQTGFASEDNMRRRIRRLFGQTPRDIRRAGKSG